MTMTISTGIHVGISSRGLSRRRWAEAVHQACAVESEAMSIRRKRRRPAFQWTLLSRVRSSRSSWGALGSVQLDSWTAGAGKQEGRRAGKQEGKWGAGGRHDRGGRWGGQGSCRIGLWAGWQVGWQRW